MIEQFLRCKMTVALQAYSRAQRIIERSIWEDGRLVGAGEQRR